MNINLVLRYAPEYYVDIEGFEGYYQVSNYGSVRSLDRVIKEKTGKTRTIKGLVLKPRINRRGYQNVDLKKQGKRKTVSAHKLVAQAFLSNPDNKPTVNHLNGIKTDNNVNNLEWATHSENLSHAHNIRLRKSPVDILSKNYHRKLNSQQVLVIKHLLKIGKLTHKEIAKIFNVGRSTISEINSGRKWKDLKIS